MYFLLIVSQFPPVQDDPFTLMSRLNIKVPLGKSMQWPVLIPCCATGPCSAWSILLSCGLYTLPSIVDQSVPRVLRRTNKEEPHTRREPQIFKRSLQGSACFPLSAMNHADIKIIHNSSVSVANDMLIRYHGQSTGLSLLELWLLFCM
jgi:hypothetical protein